MTLDEIKNVAIKRLQSMRNNELLLTEDEFEKQKHESRWYGGPGRLSRIWVAEYLDKKFKEDGRQNMGVPHFVIVVKSLDDIQLQLEMSHCWPKLSSIKNGKIYSRNIEGTDATTEVKVGYVFTDYSGEGNILKTVDGNYFVMDTEYKSFYDDMPDDHYMKKLLPLTSYSLGLCTYLRRRFSLLNNVNEWGSFSLNVSVEH